MTDAQEALEIRRRQVIRSYAEALARSGLNLDQPGVAKVVYREIREAINTATQDRVYRERHSARLEGMWFILAASPSDGSLADKVNKALTVLIIHTQTTLECENIDALASVDTFVLPGLLNLLGALVEA